MSEYIRIKKGYEYDTNKYSWWKIFEYIRISEYSTLHDMKNMIRTNIRIYSDQKNDTNEYTNIFVSKQNIRIYSNIFVFSKTTLTNTKKLNFWKYKYIQTRK